MQDVRRPPAGLEDGHEGPGGPLAVLLQPLLVLRSGLSVPASCRRTRGPRRPVVARARALGVLAGCTVVAVALRALAAAEGPLAPPVAGRWDRIPLVLGETEGTNIGAAGGW